MSGAGSVESTFSALDASAQAHGHRDALIHVETGLADEVPRKLSYAALLAGVIQTANGLSRLGVRPGDSVALMLPNLPETYFALWGAQAVGAAFPINYLLEPEAIVVLLRAARTRVLVCAGPTQGLVIWDKALKVRELMPELPWVVYTGSAEVFADRVLNWRRMTGDCASSALAFDYRAVSTDAAAFFHTGGTTGSPRLVRHTHCNELTAAQAFVAMAELAPGDVLANGFPLFHVAGAIVAGLAPLVCGATVLNLSSQGYRNPAMVTEHWRLIERYRVTVDGAVPTALASVAAIPLAGADVSSIRVGYSGGAQVPRAAATAFELATGKPLREVYGMTETAGVIAVDPVNRPRVLGSAGFAPPGTNCEVRRVGVDGSIGDRCEFDEPGMLVVQGDQVSPGYVDSAHNLGVFTVDGALITGDLARIGSDGRIMLVGRSKDLIIRSGHNIDPAVIEAAMMAHPDVAMAAAVGQPDAYAGELPICYVMAKPGCAPDPESLRIHAQQGLPERPSWPKCVHVLPQLPLTAVGKVFKPALRMDAMHRVLVELLADVPGSSVEVVDTGSGGLVARIGAEGAPGLRHAVAQRLDALPVQWEWRG